MSYITGTHSRGREFDTHLVQLQAAFRKLLIYHVLRPTQPSSFSGMGNDYHPIGGDAIYGSGVKAGMVWYGVR